MAGFSDSPLMRLVESEDILDKRCQQWSKLNDDSIRLTRRERHLSVHLFIVQAYTCG